MIFLITQMLLCIVLALVLGGAIGWIMHRSRSSARTHELRQTIGRQHAQVQQARTDVAMITQDFDELKTQAQTEIDTLRQDNKRLPSLHQNLEKSQLLVRQLMQKHEAQLRDVTTENDRLAAEVSTLRDRDAIHQRVRAELDSVRAKLAIANATDTPAAPQSATSETDATAESTADVRTDTSFDTNATDTSTSHFADSAAGTESSSVQDSPAAAPKAAPQSARSSWASSNIPDVQDDTPAESDSSALMRSIGLEFDQDDDLDASLDPDDLDADDVDNIADAIEEEMDLATGEVTFDNDEDDDEPVASSDTDTLHASFDDDVEQLFDPVDRHDDLKQIFGIGPVTEKALNELGITSYSQLADLKRHDIETIADALQIFPSRIERDDWVGNARRQLEDVLEEL